ncbi:MAG: nucleotide exchange factor GrpE [Sedimentisphaerales bacterium]
MLKKFAVIALALLFVGVALLAWVLGEKRKEKQQSARYKLKSASQSQQYLKQYNQWLQLSPEDRGPLPWGFNENGNAKSEAQLLQEQRERLKADLDKLAAGQIQIYPFTDILYGQDWQEELSKYKARKEFREFILTTSILFTSVGGAILAWCLLLLTSRLVIYGSFHLRTLLANFISRLRKAWRQYIIKAGAQHRQEDSDHKQQPQEHQGQVEKRSEVLINSGWHNFKETPRANLPGRRQPSRLQRALGVSSRPRPDETVKNADLVRNSTTAETAEKQKISDGVEKTTALLADEESLEFERPLALPQVKVATDALNLNTMQLNNPQGGTASPDAQESSMKLDDLLKAQTENLEKQVTEFRQMAQSVQQTTLEHSKPLENGLKELTQHISAIREYAAQQQNRMEKLQDGYDWNIIRTFCLRIIRCIDNLENRIAQLSERNVETAQLEEVRDELVFALESSGVEQFKPQLNSDYRGQEKKAEAVKDRHSCDDPNMPGKIAEVIKPGYQYVIDEENVKVVRMAQVRLFG